MSVMTESVSATPRPPAIPEKQRFRWQRPRLHHQSSSNRQVSFASRNARGQENGYSSHSDTSRSDDSRPTSPDGRFQSSHLWLPPGSREQLDNSSWRIIDRQTEATWREPQPSITLSPAPEPKPFLIYHDRFLQTIGPTPTLQLLMEDTRAPFFHNSPVFTPKTNTLFLSSAVMPDTSPGAAPSRNLQVVMSKIDMYSSSEFCRDKVRTPQNNYMFCGGCVYRNGLVLCAQGTLSEPASLVFLDAKRPHRTEPLLTNFFGTALNNPHACVLHADGSLWFSDPHPRHAPSFRPKPKLPPMIYRFNPQTSDLRAMTNELARPTDLAFAPDHRTLYVVDAASAPAGGGAGPPSATSRSTIYAFSVASRSSFLTQKRLFALPSAPPCALATDVLGNVYAACSDGLHVFDDCGSLIGKVLIDGGASGLAFGRNGELFVCGGHKMWRAQLDPATKGAELKI